MNKAVVTQASAAIPVVPLYLSLLPRVMKSKGLEEGCIEQIARLLFVSGRIPPAERDQTRHDLLEYCKRDTFATVRLVERLGELSRG